MDMALIENEINDFNIEFLKKFVSVQDEFTLLERSYGLIIPKENYTIIADFLTKLFSHFKSIDSKFSNSTLKNLYFDLVRLSQLLHSLSLQTQNAKTLFQTEFLPFSKTLVSLKKEINKLHNKTILSEDEEETLFFLNNSFEKLKEIYYETFQELFHQDTKYLSHRLLEIYNSKTFYFDNLLWIEARKSPLLLEYLKPIGFSTKEYLLYSSDFLKSYTKDKNYFQQCLRIYK